LRCFEAQDYVDRELVIASEDVSIAAHLPQDSRVRFVETPPGITLGEKRNLVNAAVHGDLIAHWDDDDWYAPWRLSAQVRALETGPPGAISGSRTLVFIDIATGDLWEYQYVTGSYGAHGATLCYPRDVWAALPFKHVQVASDYYFCNALTPHHAVVEPVQTICIATAHPDNTCPRRFDPPVWRRVDSTQVPSQCREWLACVRIDRVRDQV
jgi:hypothetical protein